MPSAEKITRLVSTSREERDFGRVPMRKIRENGAAEPARFP